MNISTNNIPINLLHDIMTNKNMSLKFENFSQYKDTDFLSRDKEVFYNSLRDLAIHYICKNNEGKRVLSTKEKEFIVSYFHKFFKHQLKDSVYKVLEDSFGSELFRDESYYTLLQMFIFKGKKRKEIKNRYKRRVINLVEKEMKGEPLKPSDINFIINFAKATIEDNDAFMEGEDNLIYTYIAKKILKRNYPLDNLLLFFKILGIIKTQELGVDCTFSSIEDELGSSEKGFIIKTIDGKYHIQISKESMAQLEKQISVKEKINIIGDFYSELRLLKQLSLISGKSLYNNDVLTWSKEKLAREYKRDLPSHKQAFFEHDATYMGLKYTKELLSRIIPDEYSKQDRAILKLMDEADKRRDTVVSPSDSKSVNYIFHLDKIVEEALKFNPTYLEKFPTLKLEYNNNGSLKSALQLFNERNYELNYIANQERQMINAIENGYIDRESYPNELLSLKNQTQTIKDFYSLLLSKPRQLPTSQLAIEILELNNKKKDYLVNTDIDEIIDGKLENLKANIESDSTLTSNGCDEVKVILNELVNTSIYERKVINDGLREEKLTLPEWLDAIQHNDKQCSKLRKHQEEIMQKLEYISSTNDQQPYTESIVA